MAHYNFDEKVSKDWPATKESLLPLGRFNDIVSANDDLFTLVYIHPPGISSFFPLLVAQQVFIIQKFLFTNLYL